MTPKENDKERIATLEQKLALAMDRIEELEEERAAVLEALNLVVVEDENES